MPQYRLFGLSLASPLTLPCPRARWTRRPDVRLHPATPDRFAPTRPAASPRRPSRDWFHCRRLGSGATYLQWTDLFEFLVSANGRDIAYHELGRATPESLSTYLLGQVLSFSLLAFGVEPLHATVVAIDGGAVAFLGRCGAGKSTLGAAFLALGCPVVTDDLMAVERTPSGYAVHPGMPRLKLFPGVCRRVLAGREGGTPLNYGTSKVILPLGGNEAARAPVPLRAIYVLAEPTGARRASGRVALERLSGAAALLEVIRHSFNTIVLGRERLASQFAFASRLAAAVPVTRLAYPRRLTHLPAVREALLADLPS